MNILILFGSVRTHRKGIRALRFVERQVREHGHEPIIIDPAKYHLPLLDLRYHEYDEPPEILERIAKHIASAHAVIVVSAEYNHSIPPALSNLLDHFSTQWYYRPSGIVTYSSGAFGGVRAGVQLRAMLGTLGMPSIRPMLSLPKIGEYAEDGTPPAEKIVETARTFLKELSWYAEALARQREKGLPT